MTLHVNPPSAKGNSLRRQSHPLLQAGVTRQPDISSRAQHTMPRQARRSAAQRPDYLPRRSRMPRRPRNITISGYLAPRY